jgi:hypothetical protein
MYSYSAGIIPFNRNRGFLLGKEKHGWAPFSGKSEQGETIFGTAIREFHEESCNVFQDISMSDVLDRIEAKTPRGKPFYMFVCQFPDIERNQEFLNSRQDSNDYSMLEKMELRWFSPKELTSDGYRFRNCFTNEIPYLLSFASSHGPSGSAASPAKAPGVGPPGPESGEQAG